MSAIVDLVLGIVTSIGGFVEAGSISTAAQAGAEFDLRLVWAIAAATLMLAMLAEMSGRLAAVGRVPLAGAIRERFGIHFHLVALVAEGVIDVCLLTAEIGGVAIAMRLLTGTGYLWWTLPTALIVWLIVWFSGFGVMEYGIGLLGLVTLSFVVAAWRLGADPAAVAGGLRPSLPDHDLVRYAFLAVSIVGATVSPYLLNFYASGSIEEQMTQRELWVNRATSYLGMCFGGMVSVGVLVTSALTLAPHAITADSFEQASLMFARPFGAWGTTLFALCLGIGCLGAAVELVLNTGYVTSQAFGWSWGANRRRRDAARFVAAYTLILPVALVLLWTGIDPLRLTLLSVAFTVVMMPLVVLPFLVLMNDPRYVGEHTSGPVGNALLALLTVLGAVLAVVVIPLELFGGG